MTTVLFYLVIAAAIGLVVFFLAVFVFGRGEQMAPLDPRTSPAELPDEDVTSEDVRKVRFALAVRGYRMSDVDWTLERLGDQIDQLRRENTALRVQLPPVVEDQDRVTPDGSESVDGPLVPDQEVAPGGQAAPAEAAAPTQQALSGGQAITAEPALAAGPAETVKTQDPVFSGPGHAGPANAGPMGERP